MTDIFNKTKLNKYFTYHFLGYLIFFTFGVLLVPNKSPLITFLSVFILAFYVYFIHVLFHNIPKSFNPHLMFHHDNHNKTNNSWYDYIHLWINFIVETIINIMFFVIFYLIKEFLNLSFIENIVIFYFCLVYTSTHMINYSLFHLGGVHRLHHSREKNNCNYGPDIIDKIMNTSCTNNYEDLNHIIPNSVVSYLLTSGIFKQNIL
jgi:sterol desaturase/sphingolipid hydroxylase (fatty acid hydroxylase superfamily)